MKIFRFTQQNKALNIIIAKNTYFIYRKPNANDLNDEILGLSYSGTT